MESQPRTAKKMKKLNYVIFSLLMAAALGMIVDPAFAQSVERGGLAAAGADVSLLALFWEASLVVKLVMIGLLAASVWS